MARTPYSLNTYTGGAVPASLATSVGTSDTSLTLSGPFTGWTGLGVGGGFFLVLDYGVTIAEEKVYVPAQSITWSSLGNVTLTSVVRNVDNSVAATHSIGATVRPVLTAVDLQEANTLVSQSLGQVTANGDLLVGSGANTLTKIASGAAGTILTSAGVAATPTWNNSFPAANLSAGVLPQAVTASKIWSATDTTTLNVSGYNNYLILARVQYTQPSSGAVGNNVLLSAIVDTAGIQLASSYLPASPTQQVEITGFTFLPTTTLLHTVQLSTSGPGTASARSIIVIGIN